MFESILDIFRPASTESMSSTERAEPSDPVEGDGPFVDALRGWASGEVNENALITIGGEKMDGWASGGHKGKLEIAVTMGKSTKHFFAKPVKGKAGKIEELNYDVIEHFEKEYIPPHLQMSVEEKRELQNLRLQLKDSEKVDHLMKQLLGEMASENRVEKEKRLAELEEKEKAIEEYQATNKLSEKMPKRFGTIVIEGKEYFLMEDMRKKAGGDLVPIADLKLCFTEYDVMDVTYNSIYDPEEHNFYGLVKGDFDAFQMQCQDKSAGFLMATGWLRFFNYDKSKENLIEALKGVESKQLEELKEELREIQRRLTDLPLAFIGVSILLLKDPKTGAITPKLIDPAHMQVDPMLKEAITIDGENKSVYTGESVRFNKQRCSNTKSIDAICTVIEELSGQSETRGNSPVDVVSE